MKYIRNKMVLVREDHLINSKNVPKEKMHRLAGQISCFSSSITTDIVEDRQRDSQSELTTIFQRAMGPSSELDFLLLLAYE